MERTLNIALFAIAWCFLVFLHLYGLTEIPGLHFDEAWAMNYSWRIAADPGFWPWAAMSPYTAPWAHYWGALWMKVLGPSLWAFRFSQVVLSLSGLAFLCLALPRAVRGAFPWAVLLLPGLLLNHRFAIELTGLHVLAFGVMCWGISRRWWVIACTAALVGTTAHILFYGVVLALLLALLMRQGTEVLERRARLAFSAYFAVMALFFLQVFFAIPEKGKAGALVVSALGAGIGLLAGMERWALWKSAWWSRALPVLAAVFVFNALFFAQGIWTASIYAGSDFWPLLISTVSVFPFLLLALFAAVIASISYAPPFLRTWLLAGNLFLGIMMLKPAPRYFELALLGFAACIAYSGKSIVEDLLQLAKPLRGARRFLLSLGFAFVFMMLVKGPFAAIRIVALGNTHGTIDTNLRFLFFKDSSRDFLDKQSLVKFLGSSGCKFSDIETHDPRLLESFKALQLGDWPVEERERCAYSYAARATEEGASGEPFGAFVLKRK